METTQRSSLLGQHMDPHFLIEHMTVEEVARIRLNPFDPERRNDYDPDVPRYERNWFKRFWAKLRGRRR
jgi:hypothetical protein